MKIATRAEGIKAINQLLRGNFDEVKNKDLKALLTEGAEQGILIPREFNHDLNVEKNKYKSVRQFVEVIVLGTIL